MDKKNINDKNQDEILSSVSKAGSQDLFKVPEDYFENLPGVISERQAKTSEEVFSLFRRVLVKPLYPVVASLIIILTAGLFWILSDRYVSNGSIQTEMAIYWEDVLDEDVAIFDDLNEAYLVDVLIAEIEDVEALSLDMFSDADEVSEDDLVDYMLKAGTDDLDLTELDE